MGQFKDWTRLGKGLLSFHLTGKQQEKAYQAMIGLFCRTGGWSNDVLSRAICLIRPKADLSLKEVDANRSRGWAQELEENGIVPLGTYLTPETCAQLESWARSTPAAPKPERPDLPKTVCPNPEKPIAEGYYFSEQDLVGHPMVQRLMTDPKLLALAQNYLGCEPILSIVAMWWSCAGKFSGDAARALAQMYHFDMDRPRWLKNFFYLTDVNNSNGPHVFVRKTHRTGRFPRPLLAKGYARLTDQEVSQFFGQEDQMQIVGGRGSAFAEDTRGIHKGLIPEKGYRLVLQLEFCNSLFGGQYQKQLKISDSALEPSVRDTMRKFPGIYRRFTWA